MSTPPEPTARTFPWFTAFLIVATMGLSALVALLSMENRRLKAMLDDKFAEALNASLHAGEAVDAIELVSSTGVTSRHDFSAHPSTLVLVVSTHCPHCDEAMAVWSKVIDDAKASGVPIVCIESDVVTADKMKGTPGGIPAYFVPNARTTWLTRLNMVPAALLVGSDSKVSHAWYGPPTPKERDGMTDALMAAAAKSRVDK